MKIKIIALLMCLILVSGFTGCASDVSAPDPIHSYHTEVEGAWTITKMQPISGITHFLVVLQNDEVGVLVDLTKTTEYIMFDVGDVINGTLITETTESGTFKFTDTENVYKIRGFTHLK